MCQFYVKQLNSNKKTKNMKTTEQIVQIRTLKNLIAELVAAHKSTKSKYGRCDSYLFERKQLFVAYTAYYILRHSVEDTESYIAELVSKLKQEKQNRNYRFEFFGFNAPIPQKYYNRYYGDLKEAVNACIECLNKYIESHKDEVDK
jgi:hypothetical protein